MKPIRCALGLIIVIAALLHAPVAGAALTEITGLVSDQVIQRDGSGSGQARIQGSVVGGDGGAVRFRVTSAGLALEGRGWKAARPSSGGAWTAAIENLPVGGPYKIEIEQTDASGKTLGARSIDGLLVGDLWVLAGQSNMEGVARLRDVESPSSLVHSFDMTDQWGIATEPLHERALSVYPVYWNVRSPEKGERRTGEAARQYRAERSRGAGLGLPFAKEMVQKTGVPIGLIPCAYGGTTMDQWDPQRRGEGGRSLYGAMIKRIEAAGGTIKGILWYQGESDSSENSAAQYEEKMKRFIAAVRADTNSAQLPFYYVQIGRFVTEQGSRGGWDQVQEAERRIERDVANTGVVSPIDLGLDDLIHVNTVGHQVLGRRLALLAGIDLFGENPAFKGLRRGPRLESARVDPGNKRRVVVEYFGVNGRLRAEGRVSGYSCTLDGGEAAQPFKVELDPIHPGRVTLHFQAEVKEGTKLWYGRGLNPYCNLSDEAGMAVLVAGPIDLN